jgi:hypothetical protein
VLLTRFFGDRTVLQVGRRSKKRRRFLFGSAQYSEACNTSLIWHQHHRYALQNSDGEGGFSQSFQGGEERAVLPAGRLTANFFRRIGSASEIRDQTTCVDATDQRSSRCPTTPSSPTRHRQPGALFAVLRILGSAAVGVASEVDP